MSRTLAFLSICIGGMGCGDPQVMPPDLKPLPPLSTVTPSKPDPRSLPVLSDESLVISAGDRNSPLSATCGSVVEFEYRYRLPADWKPSPDRALSSESTSQIVFKLETLHKGNRAIGATSFVAIPSRIGSGEYITKTKLKIPSKAGSSPWTLKVFVTQRAGVPYSLLHEVPIKLLPVQ